MTYGAAYTLTLLVCARYYTFHAEDVTCSLCVVVAVVLLFACFVRVIPVHAFNP